MNYKFDDIDLADKKELAKYMLDDWGFDNSKESNSKLEIELDKYIEKIANGESYSFDNTPTYDVIAFLQENVIQD